jgi:ribosomal-protein-alanine N-acetyltransferase
LLRNSSWPRPGGHALRAGEPRLLRGPVSGRGDEFYDQFAERHRAWLAEQEAGISACCVLVAEDGSVLGRFNLHDFKDGAAEPGYRVAQHVASRGVATATVRELCRLAAAWHGLRTLRAATARGNTPSGKALAKAGFVYDPGLYKDRLLLGLKGTMSEAELCLIR